MNPAEDLHRRVKLQYAIWENVLALRNGRYYNMNSDLVSTLDQCHLTHVSPSNTVVNDEGASLRRIFGAFGLNTILFNLKAAPQLLSTNLQLASSLFVPTTREEERSSLDSMITIDMSNSKEKQGAPYDFNDAMKQQSYYLDENDRYVLIDTEVKAVHRIMAIYVPRRKTSVVQRQQVGPNSIMSAVMQFNQLPLTISGMSEINNYPVLAPPAIKVGPYLLRKRSVLINEVIPYSAPNDVNNVVQLVTSTSAVIYPSEQSPIYYYNPLGVIGTLKASDGSVGRPDPVMTINAIGDQSGKDLNANFLESRQGTLFFYQTSD